MELNSTVVDTTEPSLAKNTGTLDTIVEAMEANMHLQMTYFANYVPNLEWVQQPDVTVVRSSIADDTFNYVLKAQFTPTDVTIRIAQVAEIYTKAQLPFSWWVSPSDTPCSLEDALRAQGFVAKEENSGMYLELAQSKVSRDHSELNFAHVRDQQRMRDFGTIIERIGGNPTAYHLLYSQIPPSAYYKGACLELYVAYLDSIPVVTGIVVFHAQVAGIYYVATDPEHRKKGYGTAMMNYLLAKAQSRAYTMATLQASNAGKQLYERLGFRECCTFREYVLKA